MDKLELLKDIICKNEKVSTILKRLDELNLPEHYISGPSVLELAWNYLNKKDLLDGIDVIDFVYCDKLDKNEEEIKSILKNEFKSLDIEFNVVNVAKIYFKDNKKMDMNSCELNLKEAIKLYPVIAKAIGVRSKNGEIEVFAPYGLDDVFNKILRPNKAIEDSDKYYNCVNNLIAKWTDLVIIPWDNI